MIMMMRKINLVAYFARVDCPLGEEGVGKGVSLDTCCLELFQKKLPLVTLGKLAPLHILAFYLFVLNVVISKREILC